MTAKPSLSVVMTARNEEGNLRAAVGVVLASMQDLFSPFEILIINDGSTDGTGALADQLAGQHESIRVIHHRTSQGFASSYRHGVTLARMDYVGLVTGDNEMTPGAVRAAFEAVGKADVVVPYQANQQDRPWLRRTLSRAYTTTVNLLFGLHLRYFQGPCIYSTPWAQRLPLTTDGFALLTDMLVRTLKTGHSYIEVPMSVRPREYGRSAAISLRNVVTALWTLGVLCRDTYILKRPLPADVQVAEKGTSAINPHIEKREKGA